MKQRKFDIHAPGFPLFPKLIATSFGFGFLPVAPGTWGAVFAILVWLPLYLWVAPEVTVSVTAAAVVVFTVLGTWASSVSEKYWGKDPVIACVDETVGQWISLLPVVGVAVCPWWEILLSLALFRYFDIFKPLGIRSMERLPRGYGMMADDILAGIYSAAILLIINYTVL
ncbi:MAG: phosphatidylglycerophosphatase A [Muribaculaceae bacterium]|nr:phosphatidylglycerophosphatase A [Muribaculaceae bacterium]